VLGGAAVAVIVVIALVSVVTLRHGSSTPVAAAATSSASAASSPFAGPAVASSPAPVATPSATRSPVASASTKAAAPVGTSGPRQVTFVNKVSQTIWVGSGEQTAKPALPVSGWVLAPGATLTVTVPDKWNGRFWGRTGCSFDASGHGHCQTGDCAGRFQCKQYGVIPATLAEFNLNSWQNLDFYDVSLVDGSNLPMWINITHGTTKDPISASGCSKAGCTRNVVCPAELKKNGGCESPCGVFNTDQYCCRAQWAPRSACLPQQWPVNYAALFKQAEPFAYSYVDDDATSTFTCAGECGYRITFGTSP
jgi:hypothetical protein